MRGRIYWDGFTVTVSIFIGLVVVGLAILIPYAIQEHNRWVDWCVSAGGHVDSTTSTSVGSTVVNGKVGTTTTTDTTYYCLTDDGRILDIRG